MSGATEQIEGLAAQEYKYGFVTDIEQETLTPGLNEDTVRFISAKKGEPEWLLEWRLKAFRTWQKMHEPRWPNLKFPKIDYQSISYYAAPKSDSDRPKSLDGGGPRAAGDLREAGHPAGGARRSGRSGRRRCVRQRGPSPRRSARSSRRPV